jgi:hypothetical protein
MLDRTRMRALMPVTRTRCIGTTETTKRPRRSGDPVRQRRVTMPDIWPTMQGMGSLSRTSRRARTLDLTRPGRRRMATTAMPR